MVSPNWLLTPSQMRREHERIAARITPKNVFVADIVSLGYADGAEPDMNPFPGYEWVTMRVAAVGMAR
jgi:hypothetical protein